MPSFYDCGIDLGTTNSCLAIPGETSDYEIVPNQRDRMQVTPSAVEITCRSGRIRTVVGLLASNSLRPGDVAVRFKRLMGSSQTVSFESANVTRTPEELSAEVLKQMRGDAEARLGRRVKSAVITVPATFLTLQIEATKRAAKMAGFRQVSLLQEPIAAAVAYGFRPDSDGRNWMVFDYGGGTLDVSIVTTNAGRIRVLNADGDRFFGGSDIDRLMYTELVRPALGRKGYRTEKLFDERTGMGRGAVRQVLLKCEECKMELSRKEEAHLELFDLRDDTGEEIELDLELCREDFERLIESTVDRGIEIARKALRDSGLGADRLDCILLVGGSSSMPVVQRKLKEAFQVPLRSRLDPMTVVAGGAAIYASMLPLEAEESDPKEEGDGELLYTLNYPSVAAENRVRVSGRILNPRQTHASRVCFECAQSQDFSGILWSSGWYTILEEDEGRFSADLFLPAKQLNHFRIRFADSYGRILPVTGDRLDIRYNPDAKTIGAPSATNDLGVRIWNDLYKRYILDILIEKNTELPARVQRSYSINQDMDPERISELTIEIFEGGNRWIPEANFSAGKICVTSRAVGRFLSKGTTLVIEICQDINREIHVRGIIPSLGYEIPARTLRPVSKIDSGERLGKICGRFEPARKMLRELAEPGELTGELEAIIARYNSALALIGVDESGVCRYIDDYFAVETRILTAVLFHRVNDEMQTAGAIDEKRRTIRKYAPENEEKQILELYGQHASSKDPMEQERLRKEIQALEHHILFSSFEWLTRAFRAFARGEVPMTAASDWKKLLEKGEQAIRDRKIHELRAVVCALMAHMEVSGKESSLDQLLARTD